MPRKVKTMNPISNFAIISCLLGYIPTQEDDDDAPCPHWEITSSHACVNKKIFDYYGGDKNGYCNCYP